MNIVDQFLSKVGKQTLLTSKAMMNGFLHKEEAEELERLRAIDFEIDMQALSFWERHAQGGMFRSKFDITGVNRVASTELLKFVNRLTEIEIKYEISSIESDLSRWSEIIGVLNTAVDEFGVAKEEVNALMYFYFVSGNRLTVHPTAPSVPRATIPTFISEPEDESDENIQVKFECDDGVILSSSTIVKELLDIYLVDLDHWRSENPQSRPDIMGLHRILKDFLSNPSQTNLINNAAIVFNPNTIKQIAKANFSTTSIGLLDGVREVTIVEIDRGVERHGFIDYRLLLVSMFITQVRFALENEVEK